MAPFEVFTISSPSETGKTYYRYEDRKIGCGYFDESGDFVSSDYREAVVKLLEFPVEKETPHGVWISTKQNQRKWICSHWRKCYAHPTKEEAWQSFVARKTRQRKILAAQLKHVESLLKIPLPTKQGFANHSIWHYVAKSCYSLDVSIDNLSVPTPTPSQQ